MTSSNLLDISRAHTVAQALAEEWKLEEALGPYKPHGWSADHTDLPVLHLEDISGIPFLDGVTGIEQYQHRARVRAGTGDLFAAGTEPATGYEAYCQEILELGTPDFVRAESDDLMAVALACFKPAALARLQQRASQAGGMVIHPYMAIDSVWRLAARVAEESNMPVSVLGPPPPVLWVANDKSHFSRLVEETLSADWIVETKRSSSPVKLAEALRDLATRCDMVGLKRTRCASAMGNVVLDGSELRAADQKTLRGIIDQFLTRTRWCDDEDVLVVEWRDTDLSPSTQLWVPPVGDGPPLMEGVYEQILEGPEKVFMGSRPSTLPEALNQTLAKASMQVCTALQKMGYVGRCSFDFIVTGDPENDFHAQFTECNGRWGGTSTPMHLVDRLIPNDGNGSRPAYVATDYFLPDSHIGMDFPELIDALGDTLYRPSTGSGRFILYNVGPVAKQGKFDVISLGSNPKDAHRGLHEILPQRLGL